MLKLTNLFWGREETSPPTASSPPSNCSVPYEPRRPASWAPWGERGGSYPPPPKTVRGCSALRCTQVASGRLLKHPGPRHNQCSCPLQKVHPAKAPKTQLTETKATRSSRRLNAGSARFTTAAPTIKPLTPAVRPRSGVGPAGRGGDTYAVKERSVLKKPLFLVLFV